MGSSDRTKVALDALKANLELVADARKDPRAITADPAILRTPPIAALKFVLDYLSAIEAAQGARNALGDLLGALDDANNGRHNPILKPTHDPNKPRTLTKRLSQMWTACAAATMLVDAGVDRAEALRKASKAAGTSAKKLEGFLEALLMYRRSDEAMIFYRKTLGLRDQYPSLSPKDIAERLLGSIVDQR